MIVGFERMMLNDKSRQMANRIAGVVVGVLAVVLGLASLLNGKSSYQNYWGGLVFAPVAILMGFLVLFISIFRPTKTHPPTKDRKGKRIRFPADDYRKW